MALPLDEAHDFIVEPRPLTRSRFGPALGVAVAFTGSIVLWSVLGNLIRLAWHAIF